MPSSLPASALALVEMTPVEDLCLYLLRARLPDVPVQSLIADDQGFPMVLVRRSGDWGEWKGDARFLDSGQISIHVFVDGVEADSDGALLSEAVRVILRDSVNTVVPGKGHFTKVKMQGAPNRKPDWATAVGPVQYADLPTGVVRYESVYQLEIRKPLG